MSLSESKAKYTFNSKNAPESGAFLFQTLLQPFHKETQAIANIGLIRAMTERFL
jgi:hypothetical protein